MSDVQQSPASKKLLWAGWVLSAVPVLMLFFSGVIKLMKPDGMVKEFDRLGWPEHLAVALAITEFVCAGLYLIPQTAMLGAILITGYLGGAIATHVRIGDPFFGPVIPAVLAWLGLLLRDSRLQKLLPLRRQ